MAPALMSGCLLQIAMTHSLAIRLPPANPDHHFWNSNGTWFVHYTIHPTPLTKAYARRLEQKTSPRHDYAAINCGGQRA
jgi:hypothetical protein